jgi:SAM-dependent methyltransferase
LTKDRRNPGAVDYFQRKIESFDDIYKEDNKGLISFLNRTVRASVRARFDLAFEMLGDLSGKSVLDIGCGSGRYMFRSINHNAGYVVGVDAAAGALEKAKKIAADLKIIDRLEFVQGDFLDCSFQRKFEVIFAVGYFDYIFNPQEHLKRMIDLSDGIIYASFPKRWSPLTVTRKIRLWLNGCPVRFYSKAGIVKLMRQAGVGKFEVKTIFRDFIVIIKA